MPADDVIAGVAVRRPPRRCPRDDRNGGRLRKLPAPRKTADRFPHRLEKPADRFPTGTAAATVTDSRRPTREDLRTLNTAEVAHFPTLGGSLSERCQHTQATGRVPVLCWPVRVASFPFLVPPEHVYGPGRRANVAAVGGAGAFMERDAARKAVEGAASRRAGLMLPAPQLDVFHGMRRGSESRGTHMNRNLATLELPRSCGHQPTGGRRMSRQRVGVIRWAAALDDRFLARSSGQPIHRPHLLPRIRRCGGRSWTASRRKSCGPDTNGKLSAKPTGSR